jgi:hypothetical protein
VFGPRGYQRAQNLSCDIPYSSPPGFLGRDSFKENEMEKLRENISALLWWFIIKILLSFLSNKSEKNLTNIK